MIESAEADAKSGAYLDAMCMLDTANLEIVRNIPEDLENDEVK